MGWVAAGVQPKTGPPLTEMFWPVTKSEPWPRSATAFDDRGLHRCQNRGVAEPHHVRIEYCVP